MPKCAIAQDVCEYSPSAFAKREAVAVLAGFPCQARAQSCLRSFVLKPCKDVSAAGLQKGLKGKRSSLIKRVFDVYDQLPQGPATQLKQAFEDCLSPTCRRVLFLENVGALLSRNSNCRNLWNYVHKDTCSFWS